jgi:hypothetical protein
MIFALVNRKMLKLDNDTNDFYLQKNVTFNWFFNRI